MARAQEIGDSGDGRGEVERAPPTPAPHARAHTHMHTHVCTRARTGPATWLPDASCVSSLMT